MNFKGRYYTDNNTLVAVHKFEENDNVSEGAEFWGHEVRLEPPYSDTRLFHWNSEGKCLVILGTVDNVSKFHLREQVRPATYASQIEVVDCEQCRKEKK